MVLTVLKNANLALAFFLELGVLAALGYWGFQTGQGTIAKIGLGISAPALAAGCRAWARAQQPTARDGARNSRHGAVPGERGEGTVACRIEWGWTSRPSWRPRRSG